MVDLLLLAVNAKEWCDGEKKLVLAVVFDAELGMMVVRMRLCWKWLIVLPGDFKKPGQCKMCPAFFLPVTTLASSLSWTVPVSRDMAVSRRLGWGATVDAIIG